MSTGARATEQCTLVSGQSVPWVGLVSSVGQNGQSCLFVSLGQLLNIVMMLQRKRKRERLGSVQHIDGAWCTVHGHAGCIRLNWIGASWAGSGQLWWVSSRFVVRLAIVGRRPLLVHADAGWQTYTSQRIPAKRIPVRVRIRIQLNR